MGTTDGPVLATSLPLSPTPESEWAALVERGLLRVMFAQRFEEMMERWRAECMPYLLELRYSDDQLRPVIHEALAGAFEIFLAARRKPAAEIG